MKKNTKGLFYIESPFQLLCAIEAMHQFNFDENYLFIRVNHSAINNEQVKETLKISDRFTKVVFLNISGGLTYFNIAPFYLTLLKNSFSNVTVFTGDIRPKILSLLRSFFKKSKIYILDDGVANLALHTKYPEYNFYSFLKLETPKLIKHDFSHLHSALNKDKIFNDKVVYFFGSPLVEKRIISAEYFAEKIREIVKYYQRLKIDFIYVMHRDEKLFKLDFIDSDHILQFDMPIEMQFYKTHELPKNIASFYSAALITLTEMFPDINATSFYIENEQVNKPFQNTIENCYAYYKKILKVI